LPTGREAFPERNVHCTSLQEAKELAAAGRQRSARDCNDGGHTAPVHKPVAIDDPAVVNGRWRITPEL
jgi:hypothetical protein